MEKIIDCSGLTARETEKRIWDYTDAGYQFAYSQFDNPTFVKYDKNGKVIDSVAFVYPFVGLRFIRPKEA